MPYIAIDEGYLIDSSCRGPALVMRAVGVGLTSYVVAFDHKATRRRVSGCIHIGGRLRPVSGHAVGVLQQSQKISNVMAPGGSDDAELR